jgi:hypothetical protein
VIGGHPRLRLPVTSPSITIASAFAAACARTLDASESTVESVRLVVAEMAAALLQREVATMTIEAETHSGTHILVVGVDDHSEVASDDIVQSLLATGATIEGGRWVIPITEPAP